MYISCSKKYLQKNEVVAAFVESFDDNYVVIIGEIGSSFFTNLKESKCRFFMTFVEQMKGFCF